MRFKTALWIFNTILLLLLVASIAIAKSAVAGEPLNSNLLWEAPITRVDGTSLAANEIGGYKIYHGSTNTNLSLLADVTADQIQYVHTNAPLGANYYAVTTVDTDGNESEFSNVVAKVFLAAPSTVVLTIQ